MVVPPQLIGAQQGKGVAHVLATKQTGGATLAADGALAVGDHLLVDEDVDLAGVLVIQKSCQQAQAGDVVVAPGGEYR